MEKEKTFFDYLIEDRAHLVDFIISLTSTDLSGLFDYIPKKAPNILSEKDEQGFDVKDLVEQLLDSDYGREEL